MDNETPLKQDKIWTKSNLLTIEKNVNGVSVSAMHQINEKMLKVKTRHSTVCIERPHLVLSQYIYFTERGLFRKKIRSFPEPLQSIEDL